MIAPFHPLQLALGLIVWSVWFVVLYGGLSVACAVVPPAATLGVITWVNGLLLLLTLATTALLAYWARVCWRAAAGEITRQQRFVGRIAAGVHLIAAGSTLAVGLPVIALPPCV